MRRLAAAPDFLVGSAHAVTEEGSALIASASGSQLGPLVSGAGHVILVIGGQKIVADLATGLRRIHEYCFPLEDRRRVRPTARKAVVNNILIINKVVTPSRVTAIVVGGPWGSETRECPGVQWCPGALISEDGKRNSVSGTADDCALGPDRLPDRDGRGHSL